MLTAVNRAYPTALGIENPVYSWQGTLPTIDAMGKPVCSTVSSPSRATVPYQAAITPSFTVGTKDKEDPFGYLYSLDKPVCLHPANKDINPDDAAPKLCSADGVCGAHALQTALYLTETSSSFENVPDAANKPAPTPTPYNPYLVPAPKPNPPDPAPALKPNPPYPAPAPKPNPADPAPAPKPPTPVPNTPALVPAQTTPVLSQPIKTPDAAAGIAALLNPGSQPAPAQVGWTPPAIPQPTIGTGGANTQAANSPIAETPNSPPPAPAPASAPAAVIVVGSNSITANPDSVFVIGGQSLSPGGAVIVDGTSITLDSAGQVAVVGGVTQQVQTVPAAQNEPPAPAPTPIFSIGDQTITAHPNAPIVVAGETIAPGTAVVVEGNTISVLPSSVGIVVNGVTQIFQPEPHPLPPPGLILNGQTYTVNPQSAYVIGEQTLLPGQTIVVSGTTIALAPSGDVAVINGVTQTIAPSPAPTITTNDPNGIGSNATTPTISGTSTNGVGDYIASGIGFGSNGTSKPKGTTTSAGAGNSGIEMGALFFGSLIGIFGVMLFV